MGYFDRCARAGGKRAGRGRAGGEVGLVLRGDAQVAQVAGVQGGLHSQPKGLGIPSHTLSGASERQAARRPDGQ